MRSRTASSASSAGARTRAAMRTGSRASRAAGARSGCCRRRRRGSRGRRDGRKSSQFGVRRMTRDAAASVGDRRRAAGGACRRTRSRRWIWSMASTAVVGSLIAGDSAFSAMSTRMRNANIGSCSSVRSGPNATRRAQRASSDRARAPPYRRTAARRCAMKSPTCGTSSITPSCALRLRDERAQIDREHDSRRAVRAARCASAAPSVARRARLRRGESPSAIGIDRLDHRDARVRRRARRCSPGAAGAPRSR